MDWMDVRLEIDFYMKNSTIFISLIVAMLSCSLVDKNAPEEIETIRIDVDKSTKTKDISAWIDTSYYEIVPLETKPNCLIGEIKKIWVRGNKILVYDEMAKGIYVFNRDGSYHGCIIAVGNGPGQYPLPLNDVVVTDSHIYIFPPVSGKIFAYDFEGKFEKTIDLNGTWGDTFFTWDEEVFNLIASWSNSKRGAFQLHVLDTKNNCVNSIGPVNENDLKNRRGWGLDNYYSLYNKRALILVSTVDTIFEVSEDKIFVPRYYADIQKKKLPHKIACGNAYEALHYAINNDCIKGIDKIEETSRYLFLMLGDSEKDYIVTYDKKKKEVESISNFFTIHAWGDIQCSLSQSSVIENDTLISWISANICMRWKENNFGSYNFNNKGFEDAYKKAINSIRTEEDNPVVFLIKFEK